MAIGRNKLISSGMLLMRVMLVVLCWVKLGCKKCCIQ